MMAFPDDGTGSGRYLQAVRQHWPFILLSAAIAVAAAIAYSTVAQKRYEARADVLVTPIPAGAGSFVGIPLIAESATSRSVLTAARLVGSPQVAAGVKQRLTSSQSIDGLLDAIDVTPQQQSAILTIAANAASPEGAARLANAFADVLVAQRTALFREQVRTMIRRLELRLRALGDDSTAPEATALASRLGDLRALSVGSDPTLQIASRAVPPTSADWPRPVLGVMVALVAGLLLGLGVAVGLELVNPLVLRDEDVRMPVLAHVPRQPARTSRDGSLPEDVREAYRRARLTLAAGDSSGVMPRTILVTSVADGDSSAPVAVGLAATAAAAGVPTALIDANLRRPQLARVLGATNAAPGLAAVLTGDVEVVDAVVPTPVYPARLWLLPSPLSHDPPVDLLQAPGLGGVVAELDTDVVVIDSPPAGLFVDALLIAGDVDAVVVAVRLGRTRRDRLVELRRAFAQRGIVPAGAIMLPRGRFWERRRPQSFDAPTPSDANTNESQRAQSSRTSVRTDGGRDAFTRDRAGGGR